MTNDIDSILKAALKRCFGANDEFDVNKLREFHHFKKMSLALSAGFRFSDLFTNPIKRRIAVWTSFRYEETILFLDDLLRHSIEVKYFIFDAVIYIGQTTIYDILYEDIRKINYTELSQNDNLDFIVTFTEEDFASATELCSKRTNAEILYLPDLVDLILVEKQAYPSFAKGLPPGNNRTCFVLQWPQDSLGYTDFFSANNVFETRKSNHVDMRFSIHIFYFLELPHTVRHVFSSVLEKCLQNEASETIRIVSHVCLCGNISEAAVFASRKIDIGEIRKEDRMLFIFPEEGYATSLTQGELTNDFAARVRKDLGLIVLNIEKHLPAGAPTVFFDYRHAAWEMSRYILEHTPSVEHKGPNRTGFVDFFTVLNHSTLAIYNRFKIQKEAQILTREIAAENILIQLLTDDEMDVLCDESPYRTLSPDNLALHPDIRLGLSFDNDIPIEIIKEWQKKSDVEVITHKELIEIVEDRYFLLEPFAEEIAKTGIDACILGWASVDQADASSPLGQTELSAVFPGPDDAAKFYRDIASYGKEYHDEIFSPHTQMIEKNGLLKMSDCAGNFFNVRNGMRITTGQPESPQRSVHIFGDEIVLGIGAEDSHTIASLLQKTINSQQTVKTRVLNHGLMDRDVTARKIMDNFKRLIEEAIIKEGNIAIFLVNPLFHEIKGKRQKNATRYIETYMEKKGVHYLDLVPALRIAQKNNPIYIGGRHVNHRGYQAVANKIFFDFLRAKI